MKPKKPTLPVYCPPHPNEPVAPSPTVSVSKSIWSAENCRSGDGGSISLDALLAKVSEYSMDAQYRDVFIAWECSYGYDGDADSFDINLIHTVQKPDPKYTKNLKKYEELRKKFEQDVREWKVVKHQIDVRDLEQQIAFLKKKTPAKKIAELEEKLRKLTSGSEA